MSKVLDIEDFPPGTPVKTPTGLMGTVVKARGSESKQDHFQRIVVQIGPRKGNTVTLQPGLLKKHDERQD